MEHNFLGLRPELVEIIKDEVNVKKVTFKNLPNTKIGEKVKYKIYLDTRITPELKLEGQAREIIRHIQQMRKEADFQVDDRIEVGYQGGDDVFANFGDMIAKEVLAEKFEKGSLGEFDLEKELKLDDGKVLIQVKK